MGLAADLRFALRGLRRRPGFTAVAVATLALGIGANAAMFALVDAIAFRPLPVRAPEQLVALFASRPDAPVMGFSFPDYRDLRDGIRSLAEMAAFREHPVSVEGEQGAEIAWGMLVTGNYFPLLGVEAAQGRLFGPEEGGRDGAGGAPVAVLSHRFWSERLGGDAGVVGRTLRLNGHPFTVVGVAGDGFLGTRLFSYAPDLWLPLFRHEAVMPGSEGMLERRGSGSFHLIGRLAAGADRERAAAEAALVSQRLAAAYPDDTFRSAVRVISNRTAINPWAASPEQLRVTGLLALAGVAVVLLVACANVANLLLARAGARRRELAVRASLGASRWALARQLLAESVLLAGAGGVGGLLIGWWGSRLAPALLPDLDFALAVDPHLDGRVVAFTFAASLLAVVVFGLLPARRAAAADPAGELKAGAGAGVGGRGGLRQALVAAQVALSVVVLVAAGLFLRSLAQAQQLDLGFRADEALVFAIDPGLQGYSEEAAAALQERLARRIRELPTVAGVTWADDLPLDGNSSSTPVAPAGSAAAPEEQVTAYYQRVEEGYFAQMEVPLLAGRGLATADLERETEAAVISASLAAALWPGEEAVGRRIGLAGGRGEVVEVVGVAADVKLSWLGEASSPALYFDLRRNPRSKVYFVVRHQGAAAAVAPALRQAVRELDPRLPVLGLGTLRAHLAPAFTPAENGAWLSGAFALLALLLSLSGIYGVIAYGVAQRLREMAVRLAVGASPRRLQWQVLGRALRPLGYGLVAGLVAAVAVSRLLRGLLYGVSPADPLTYTLAASVLVAAGAVAGWLPARRAARVDPAAILRSEA